MDMYCTRISRVSRVYIQHRGDARACVRERERDPKGRRNMGRARDSPSPTMQERNRRASLATSSTKEDALRFAEVDTNGDQELDLYERPFAL